MAGNIKGITIEFNGDTTKLGKALTSVNKEIKKTDSALREVDKALKLDPKNTELVAQKQALLAKQVQQTKDKLQLEQTAAKAAGDAMKNGAGVSQEEYAKLSAEVVKTEQNLKKLEDSSKSTKKIGDEAKESESKVKGLGDAGAKMGSAVASGAEIAVKSIGAITAAAGAALAAVGKIALDLATNVVTSFADLEQALGGSEAVFQEYAGTIQAAAEESYRTMGTSQEEYLSYANKIGALYQGVGLSVEDSADITQRAMARAADMASVMGIDMTTALDAVAGAAKNNYTMMDNLGVSMNATILKDYAQSLGMVWTEMSAADQATLAMEYFFTQTEQYAGNFEREATETISGSMGMLTASWQSLIAGLGNSEADINNLTQNVVDAFGHVVDNIVPVLDNLAIALPAAFEQAVTAIGESGVLETILSTASSIMTSLFGALTDAIPQVTTFIQTLIGSIATTISENQESFSMAFQGIITAAVDLFTTLAPILIPVALDALGALGSALLDNIDLVLDCISTLLTRLTAAFTNPATISKVVTAGVQMITSLVQGLLAPQNVRALASGAAELFIGLVDGLDETLPMLIDATVLALNEIIGALTQPDVLERLIESTISLILNVTQALIDNTPMLVDTVVMLLGNIAMALVDEAPLILTALGELIGMIGVELLQLLFSLGGTTFDEVVNNLTTIGTVLTEFGSTVISKITTWFSDTLTKIGGFVSDVIDKVLTFFTDLGSDMQTGLDNAITAVSDFATNLWNSIVQLYTDVTGKVSEIATDISTTFTDLIDSALNWGSDLINNIVQGIQDGIGAVSDAATAVAQSIADRLHFTVPKTGPLSDFDETMGQHLIQNLINGIDSEQVALQRSLVTTGNTIYEGVTSPDYTGILGGISTQLAGLGGGMPSVINVYVGNQRLATAVVDANNTNNYRTGGI